MNRTRRVAIGLTAVLASAGLFLGGATGAQAHDRGDGPLSALVTNGTLTSAELTAVKDALRSAHESGRAEHVAEKKAARTAALAPLVAKGTLTQGQADAIASAERGDIRDLVREWPTVTREKWRAVHDALKSGRSELRNEHRAEKVADLTAALSALVTKGTLTQAKADAVKAALADRLGRDGRKPGKGPRGAIR
ncbi:MAG: hypothetical protein FJW97_08415 [Actinobacteria bacterium]|nr:hypothetical protein [Actinomycetota bacterium]